MKKGLAIAALITLALVAIGLLLAGGAISSPLAELPPQCSSTTKKNCLWYINTKGRPLPNTINASVGNGAVLTINNTATGPNPTEKGLYATGEWAGVHGYSATGYGVWGAGLYGVVGSGSGTGVYAYSSSGLPLYINGDSGSDLIEAWDSSSNVRFKVTRSGMLMLAQLSSAPATCDSSIEGAIYYDDAADKFYGCNGSAWQPLN